MRLGLFSAVLTSVLLPITVAQRCNLVYCTRFGQRAECVYQSDLSPCALWHSLEMRVNPGLCDSNCPLQCDPADRRPIASDGKVYCTECALRYASCDSRFVVYGPINFGSPSDLPFAPIGVGVTPPPTPSPSSLPLVELDSTMPIPSIVPLPSPANLSIGPFEMGQSMLAPALMPSEALEESPIPIQSPMADDSVESPMPSSPEDYFTGSPEEIALSCEGDLNIFERVECCMKLDIGCIQAGQDCSTSGSLFPPVPCAQGLECIIWDPGFPAADRPNRGTCSANAKAMGNYESEEPEEPSESPIIARPSGELSAGAFCSTQGGLFPAPSCKSGLFCDVFDSGLPAADVPNRGVCRPVGSTPLTVALETPFPNVPMECQGDLDNLTLRTCCLDSGVRCLRRGQLCSSGSRIPPIPCEAGLFCRIFDPGFPAVDIPNRGVCL
ncbi:unnamed protein product [Agarophyton chilense]